MIHIHRFGKWDDVELKEIVRVQPMASFIIMPVQIIKQQRRCSICNLVKTRYSA